jgi:hypothetical protein
MVKVSDGEEDDEELSGNTKVGMAHATVIPWSLRGNAQKISARRDERNQDQEDEPAKSQNVCNRMSLKIARRAN